MSSGSLLEKQLPKRSCCGLSQPSLRQGRCLRRPWGCQPPSGGSAPLPNTVASPVSLIVHDLLPPSFLPVWLCVARFIISMETSCLNSEVYFGGGECQSHSSSIKFLQTEVYPTSENRCVAGAGGKLWEQWKCFPPLELQPQNRCRVGTRGEDSVHWKQSHKRA